MTTDEEFRRVAEEIRALARSLARDFREAVDQSRAGGSRPGEAIRHGLRDISDEARRSMRHTVAELRPRHRGYRGRQRGWSPPQPPQGAPSSPPPRQGFPPPRPRPGRPRRLPPVRHRWDATTVLGAVAVVFGIAWLLDTLHVAHISVEAAVAAALMVLGAAMIVTGRTDWSLSRRAWPVFAGVGLILVLIATSTTFGVVSGSGMASFGNRSVTIRTPGQTVQGGFGNMNVDASGLTAGGSLTIANVAGVVRVSLPEGVAAHIDARILAGQVCIAGQNAGNGVDVNAHRDLAGTSGSTSGPAVSLNVHEVSGEVLIGAGGCSG